MIVNHRPSILKRPLRPNGNMANEENAEKEYEKEQARIRSHATWQADTQERMRKAFYARPDERHGMQKEMSSALKQQMARRRAEESDRALQERQCFPDNVVAVPQDRSRPWTATTQQLTAQEEAAARHRAAAAAAEENRFASAQRAAAEQQRAAAERATAAHELQSEGSYWNYGAASAKWVPPEQRVRGTGAASAHAPPPRPAPYTWDESAAAGNRSPQPLPPPPPFSWDESDAAARPRSAAPDLRTPYSTHSAADMAPASRAVPKQAGNHIPVCRQQTPAPFWTQEDAASKPAAGVAAPRPAAGDRPQSADRVYPWSWST